MDDFTKTVGEKALGSLYQKTVELLSSGIPGFPYAINYMVKLEMSIRAMDSVMQPLCRKNPQYMTTRNDMVNELSRLAKETIHVSDEALKTKIYMDRFALLRTWFEALNDVIDTNNLLFATSVIYQEKPSEQDEETPP